MDQNFNTILARLDERTIGIKQDAEDTLEQLKTLNSKVATHEREIHEIKLTIAKSQGHWAGVNKTLAIGLTIVSILAGVIATMLWH